MLSVEQIYQELGGKDGVREGITYGLSNGNSLDELLATPNLWGHDPSITDYIPAATNLTQAITRLLSSATRSIDISVLYRFPDGYFLNALKEGINTAYKEGHKPLVRILCGCYYPLNADEDIVNFIKALDAPQDIEVYVAMMQTWLMAWNHSKLIIVDGKTAISGGHNLWNDDYTQFAPVNDVSMRLSGKALSVAEGFLNELWRFVATGSGSIIKGAYWHKKSFQGQITDDVAGPIKSPVPPDFGKVKILSLGRTGANLESPPVPADNAARTARIRAVQMADNHVRLSQQMLGGSLLGFYDIPLLGVICQHVINNKQLSIIMSDTGASTQSKDDYYGDGIEATAKWLASIIAVMSRLNRDKLIALLTRNVHLAPIRIYDKQPGDPEAKSWMWRRTKEHLETKIRIEPANHAKVFIYDDDGFFFGSDNAYKMPLSNLGMQEFGFMVSDKEETRKFINNYWDKAWYYSSQFEFKDWENIVSEVFANPTDVELLLRDIDLF